MFVIIVIIIIIIIIIATNIVIIWAAGKLLPGITTCALLSFSTLDLTWQDQPYFAHFVSFLGQHLWTRYSFLGVLILKCHGCQVALHVGMNERGIWFVGVFCVLFLLSFLCDARLFSKNSLIYSPIISAHPPHLGLARWATWDLWIGEADTPLQPALPACTPARQDLKQVTVHSDTQNLNETESVIFSRRLNRRLLMRLNLRLCTKPNSRIFLRQHTGQSGATQVTLVKLTHGPSTLQDISPNSGVAIVTCMPKAVISGWSNRQIVHCEQLQTKFAKTRVIDPSLPG